ncbi:globin-like protein, partial [Absidia repens]
PTQSDIDIVRTSWERVVNLTQPKDPASVSPAQGFGLAFYDALFDLDPQVRSLFGTNVLVQAKMLTYVIAYIARAPLIATTTTTTTTTKDLDPEWLVMKLRELGARHHYYKVEPEQFQLVGPAIDTALRVRLQDEYTVEIGKAWTKTHAYVAHHMALGLVSQRQWEK